MSIPKQIGFYGKPSPRVLIFVLNASNRLGRSGMPRVFARASWHASYCAGSSGDLFSALRLGGADGFYKLHRALDSAVAGISVLFAIQ